MSSIKNRRSSLLCLLACSFLFLLACQPADNAPMPEPEPEPPRETVVTVAGWCETDDLSYPGYWQDGRWTDLSVCANPGVEWPVRYAFSVFVSGSDVHVAGYNSCDSRCAACYWKNGARTDLKHPGADSYASSIYVSGNDVYIAGWIDFGAYTVPCYWKNGERIELSRTGPSPVDKAVAIVVSGGDVYVAGTINKSPDASQPISSPCYWKNGERVDLKAYDSLNLGFGNSICILHGKVYVGGYVMYGCSPMPCYWADGVRIDLKRDVPGWVYSIQVSVTDVYLAGMVRDESSRTIPCQWRNAERTDLELDGPEQGGYAGSISVLDNNVFVAGFIDTGSYFKVPCYWKNGVRTDLKLGSYPGGTAQGVFVTYK